MLSAYTASETVPQKNVLLNVQNVGPSTAHVQQQDPLLWGLLDL